jgi:hypothetical protein
MWASLHDLVAKAKEDSASVHRDLLRSAPEAILRLLPDARLHFPELVRGLLTAAAYLRWFGGLPHTGDDLVSLAICLELVVGTPRSGPPCSVGSLVDLVAAGKRESGDRPPISDADVVDAYLGLADSLLVSAEPQVKLQAILRMYCLSIRVLHAVAVVLLEQRS